MADGVSSASDVDTNRYKKYFEGWIEHKSAKGNTWSTLWLILRGTIIFIFDSKKTHLPKSMKGQLFLNPDTDVHIINDTKTKKIKGYIFDLVTKGRDGQHKTNRFRCNSVGERDLWIGYILGIANGQLADNIHLLPGQRQDIQLAIHDLRNTPITMAGVVPPVPPGHPINRTVSQNSVGSNSTGSQSDSSGTQSSPNRQSVGQRIPSSLFDHGGATIGSKTALTLSSMAVSPAQDEAKHPFYSDPARQRETPTWFFGSCSREKSEAVLAEYSQFGNVLMRESTSFKTSGTYVISLRRVVQGGAQINHYEVNKTSQGYKINVDNEHASMACLTDVMSFFVTEAGPSTRPFTKNDFGSLFDSSSSTATLSVWDHNENHIERTLEDFNSLAIEANAASRLSMPHYDAPPPPRANNSVLDNRLSKSSTSSSENNRMSGLSGYSSASSQGHSQGHPGELFSVPENVGSKIKGTVQRMSQGLAASPPTSAHLDTPIPAAGQSQADREDSMYYVNQNQTRKSSMPGRFEHVPADHNLDYGDGDSVHTGSLQAEEVYLNSSQGKINRRTLSEPSSSLAASSINPAASTSNHHQFRNPALNELVPKSPNKQPQHFPGYAGFLLGSSESNRRQATRETPGERQSNQKAPPLPPARKTQQPQHNQQLQQLPQTPSSATTTNLNFGDELNARLKNRRQDIYQSNEQVRFSNY